MDNKDYRLKPDIANMKEEIFNLAKTTLEDVSEDNLKYFSEEAKRVAESTFEQYVFSVYDLYTKGALKISNDESLDAFIDMNKGYQSVMLAWKKEQPIKLVQRSIEIKEPTVESQSFKSYHKETAVVGTVVATALAIFSKLWIGIAVEMLTIAAAILQNKSYTKNKENYAAKVKQYNIELKNKKQQFINGVIGDLCKWVDMGVEKSDEVLKAFNL